MQTRRLHQLGQGANENGRADASADRLWVVDLGHGRLRVVQGQEALKQLIASHGLPSSARAYELSAVPRTLADIAEVAPAFERPAPAPAPVVEEVAAAPTAPAKVEVAVAPAAPAKVEVALAPATVELAPAAPAAIEVARPAPVEPPHHDSHDAEFSLLDRPFDDTDYFEEPRRWPRIAGASALLALLIGGGYKLTHSRHDARARPSPRQRPRRP